MIRVLFLFFILLLSLSIFGQENYGYINYSKVVKVLPEYSSGQNHIRLIEEKYIDTLKTFHKKMENYLNSMAHNATPDSIKKIEIEDSLMATQEEFQKFQVLANKEIEKEQNILDEKLKILIVSKLKLFCSEHDIVCIHEEESILHCFDCIDYTNMFIEYLKK
tara:strand:+ start:201 stop:689 length:489 start_codon:yes stop_codon:yes gene_type:complete